MKFQSEESKASSQRMLNIMKFRDVEKVIDFEKKAPSGDSSKINSAIRGDRLPSRSFNLNKPTSKSQSTTSRTTTSKEPPSTSSSNRLLNRRIGKIPLISTEAAGLSYFKKIEGIEVVSDITKWFTFEALIPNSPDLKTSFIIGSVAGLTSQVVKETKTKNQAYTNDSIIKDTRPLRLLRSALEGSVQFWTYSYTRTLFKMIETNMNNQGKPDIHNIGTFLTGLDTNFLSGNDIMHLTGLDTIHLSGLGLLQLIP